MHWYMNLKNSNFMQKHLLYVLQMTVRKVYGGEIQDLFD